MKVSVNSNVLDHLCREARQGSKAAYAELAILANHSPEIKDYVEMYGRFIDIHEDQNIDKSGVIVLGIAHVGEFNGRAITLSNKYDYKVVVRDDVSYLVPLDKNKPPIYIDDIDINKVREAAQAAVGKVRRG